MDNRKHYPALIDRGEDGNYGVLFPDFMGCVTVGSSLDEAYKMAQEVLLFHVEGMLEGGEEIPEPSSLERAHELRAEFGAEVILTVPVVLPAKSKRINVSFNENLLGEIDRTAKSQGKTRSAFLADAARLVIASSGQ